MMLYLKKKATYGTVCVKYDPAYMTFWVDLNLVARSGNHLS